MLLQLIVEAILYFQIQLFCRTQVWRRPENDQSPSVSNDVQSHISLILDN